MDFNIPILFSIFKTIKQRLQCRFYLIWKNFMINLMNISISLINFFIFVLSIYLFKVEMCIMIILSVFSFSFFFKEIYFFFFWIKITFYYSIIDYFLVYHSSLHLKKFYSLEYFYDNLFIYGANVHYCNSFLINYFWWFSISCFLSFSKKIFFNKE